MSTALVSSALSALVQMTSSLFQFNRIESLVAAQVLLKPKKYTDPFLLRYVTNVFNELAHKLTHELKSGRRRRRSLNIKPLQRAAWG